MNFLFLVVQADLSLPQIQEFTSGKAEYQLPISGKYHNKMTK
jgi:hypothetical protein